MLQRDNEPPQFCLGAVAESYPPPCTGPVIRGWDWSVVGHFESASSVMWGTYAVYGTWDGTEFTTTCTPIPLSLYDTVRFVDPRLAETGDGDEHQLQRIQAELLAAENHDILSSETSNGHLVVTVLFDDGTIQASLDEQYGGNLIVIQSALNPV